MQPSVPLTHTDAMRHGGYQQQPAGSSAYSHQPPTGSAYSQPGGAAPARQPPTGAPPRYPYPGTGGHPAYAPGYQAQGQPPPAAVRAATARPKGARSVAGWSSAATISR